MRRFGWIAKSQLLVTLVWMSAVRASAQSQPASDSQPAGVSTTAATQPSSAPTTATSRPATATERVSEMTTPEVTPQSLQKTIKEIEESSGLDEALKGELLSIYREALQELSRGLELSGRAADFTLRIHAAGDDLAEVKAELEQPLPDLELGISPAAPLIGAQRVLTEAEAELADRQSRMDELEQEQQNRAERRRVIPELVAAAQSKLDANRESEAGSNDAASLIEARRIARRARESALRDELAALQAELSAYDARAEILVARRDLAARKLAQQKKLVTALRSVMQEIRRLEKDKAAQEAQEARERAARAHPTIKELLNQNIDLAQEKMKLGERLEQSGTAVEKTRTELEDRVSESKRLREILNIVGQAPELGVVLRAARSKLPNPRDYERELHRDQKEIAAAQIRQFELSRASAALAMVDDEVDAVLAKLEPGTDDVLRERVATAAREQFQTRKKLVDELQIMLDRLIGDLSKRSQDCKALVVESTALTELINENVLWIQSLAPLGSDDPGLIRTGVVRLAQPRSWSDGLKNLGNTLRNNPLEAAMGGAAIVVLILLQPFLRRDLRSIRDRVGRASTDLFRDTLRAFAWTLLLAAPGPLLLTLLREAISSSSVVHEYQHALVVALKRAAITWFAVGFVWHMARRNGLAEVHFRFRPEVVGVLRRTTFWMLVLLVPIAGLSTFLAVTPDEMGLKYFGRVVFMVRSALMTAFMAYLLRPSGPILDRFLEQTRGGWLDRLRFIWYPLIILMPLSLVALAGMGYYFTAGQLELRTQNTWILLLSLIVGHLLVMRWLLVAAKHLALEKAESHAKRSPPASVPAAAGAAPVVVEHPELTAGEISAQTRQLLRTLVGFIFVVGIWWNWADTFPALRFLENYKVFDNTVVQTVSGGDGKSEGGTTTTQVLGKPITLADCVAAAVALIFTVVLAKNIPGVLEITVLQRLPLEPSARYAITTVCSYLITIVGLAISFGALGIGWSKVQWLAAAVTFGLGFGLQEIFANFVSGLILLFERPIRLGDTVTVGDISGTVTRIRIRATTITDADRRDLVVPNKEFIVGRFINWTLTDDTLRVVIPVGVAYGADIEQVRTIMTRVAIDHPDVNLEPKPRSFFLGFTENALKFELRLYVSGPSDASMVQNDVGGAIYREFQKAGIALAHPMREIRVHSGDGKGGTVSVTAVTGPAAPATTHSPPPAPGVRR